MSRVFSVEEIDSSVDPIRCIHVISLLLKKMEERRCDIKCKQQSNREY